MKLIGFLLCLFSLKALTEGVADISVLGLSVLGVYLILKEE